MPFLHSPFQYKCCFFFHSQNLFFSQVILVGNKCDMEDERVSLGMMMMMMMMMMKTQLVVKYDESDGGKFENSGRHNEIDDGTV